MSTKVFISYAREDREIAEKLYRDLQKPGVQPWIDSFDLGLGQPWEEAIRKAISECRYFVTLMSSRSVRKKGHVQKESRQALEIAKEYPEDEVFILPLRLDECEPTFAGIRRVQWGDLFPSYEEGLKKLLRVFNYELEEKQALVVVDEVGRNGVIKKLADKAGGFGFITRQFEDKDIFFHHKELIGVQFDELRPGDAVTFLIAKGPKGIVAVGVKRA